MELKERRLPHAGGCPAEKLCPFRTFCELYSSEESNPLHPSTYEVEKSEVFITNPSLKNRVYVFQTGAYMSMGELNSGEEVPFAVYGQGIAVGLTELYTPKTLSDTYHMRSLLPGTICSVPTSTLKEKLEALPQAFSHKILSAAFTNQSTAAFTLSAIRAQSFIYDRVRGVLLYLRDLSHSKGVEVTSFGITHEEIALLVSANRMAVTRVLKRMQEDGLIEYSYKSVALTEKMIKEYPEVYLSYFISLDDGEEFHDNFASIYLDRPMLSDN